MTQQQISNWFDSLENAPEFTWRRLLFDLIWLLILAAFGGICIFLAYIFS